MGLRDAARPRSIAPFGVSNGRGYVEFTKAPVRGHLLGAVARAPSRRVGASLAGMRLGALAATAGNDTYQTPADLAAAMVLAAKLQKAEPKQYPVALATKLAETVLAFAQVNLAYVRDNYITPFSTYDPVTGVFNPPSASVLSPTILQVSTQMTKASAIMAQVYLPFLYKAGGSAGGATPVSLPTQRPDKIDQSGNLDWSTALVSTTFADDVVNSLNWVDAANEGVNGLEGTSFWGEYAKTLQDTLAAILDWLGHLLDKVGLGWWALLPWWVQAGIILGGGLSLVGGVYKLKAAYRDAHAR